MRFEPTEKQYLCWNYLTDKTTKQIFYGGAAGGGKTFLGCSWIIINCLQYPGTRWLIGRSKLKRLKQGTFKTFMEIINNNGLSKQVKYNQIQDEVKFLNGSEVILMDLFPFPTDPDFDRFGSLEISGAFIDELSDVDFQAYQTILSRIRYRLSEYKLSPKIFAASNPTKGWPYSYFYLPWRNQCERDDVKFIQALPTDNPYQSETYYETLQSLQPKLKSRLYDGNWEFTSDENDLVHYEQLMQCFYNPDITTSGSTMYLCADIADLGSDRTVLSIWNNWSLIKYIILEKKDTKYIVEAIKELMVTYKILIKNVIIDGTGVGAGVCSYLPGSVRYNASERALNGEKYPNIKSQLWFKFSSKINELAVSFLMPYDDVLAQEVCAYKKSVSNEKVTISSKDEVKRMLGRSPDIADSLYLRAYYEYKQNNISWKMVN